MSIVENIPLDMIVDPKQDLRTVVEREGLEELARSIASIGVIQPCVVKKLNDHYEIVAGWRRVTAARMAKLVAIPCLVLKKKPEFEDEIRIHENLYRKDVSPVDYARYFDYLERSKGYSNEEVARLIGKSKAYVQQRLMLLRGDEAVLAALEADLISFEVARELAAVEDDKDREHFLRVAVENGVSGKVMRGWKQSSNVAHRSRPSVVRLEPEIEPRGGEVRLLERCAICKGEESPDHLYDVRVCESCYRAVMERGGKG